jgi:hypothetical protein
MQVGKKFERMIILWIQLALVTTSFGATESKPKYGPRASPKAVPLSQSYDYSGDKKNKTPHFWALISYYIGQFNPYSCSSASLAMVVNAARAGLPKTAQDKVITENDLLDKADVENWKKRLSPGGLEGVYGSTLTLLGRVSEMAFKEFGFPKATVKVIPVSSATDQKIRQEVIRLLKSQAFIIANFDQKEFTDDAQVGHFAPVGAFDEKRARVLILDPDREYYEPYWVSLDSFLKGMATLDPYEKKPRGLIAIFPNT